MKNIKINIAFLLLLFATLVASCQDSDETLQEIVQTEETKYAQVAFNVTVPLSSLPSSRAIANDAAINDYVIWVFNEEKFVEAIYPTNPRLSYDMSNGETMTITLNEDLTKAKLVMIANISGIITPTEGTPLADARNSLGNFTNSNTMEYMPMYGEMEQSFNVKTGGNGGTITLIRAMAMVEVDTSQATDHFELKEMYVCRVNGTGTIVKQASITNNNPMIGSIQGTLNGTKAYVYLPEIAGVNGDSKTFVIVKGKYGYDDNNRTDKWYRLDFIKRTSTQSSGVSYELIENIERNHKYIFEIKYLSNGAGHAVGESTLETILSEAQSVDADNKIADNEIQTILIDNKDIMDITTNNYIYLGVTSANLTAKKSQYSQQYAVRLSVVTNNPDGWFLENLPSDVTLTKPAWTETDVEKVQSAWVYIDGDVEAGQDRVIYIYSGNIRKQITIKTSSEPLSEETE